MSQFFSYDDNYKIEETFFPLKERHWKMYDEIFISMSFTAKQLKIMDLL